MLKLSIIRIEDKDLEIIGYHKSIMNYKHYNVNEKMYSTSMHCTGK